MKPCTAACCTCCVALPEAPELRKLKYTCSTWDRARQHIAHQHTHLFSTHLSMCSSKHGSMTDVPSFGGGTHMPSVQISQPHNVRTR
jgi:hypothetical protein